MCDVGDRGVCNVGSTVCMMLGINGRGGGGG